MATKGSLSYSDSELLDSELLDSELLDSELLDSELLDSELLLDSGTLAATAAAGTTEIGLVALTTRDGSRLTRFGFGFSFGATTTAPTA